LEQVHFRLLHFHAFSADADDGVGDAHQDSAGGRDRARHFLEFEAAVLVLGELKHRRWKLTSRRGAGHGSPQVSAAFAAVRAANATLLGILLRSGRWLLRFIACRR